VLDAAQLLECGVLVETAGLLRQQFREEAAKFPLLAARTTALADFRDTLARFAAACCPPTGDQR